MSSQCFQKQIASRIKQLRLKRGLLQKDFAQYGYTVRHYQKIESGRLNFTLKTLYKISQALDVEVADFVKQDEDWSSVYQHIFFECPFGIIVWRLKDLADPESLYLFEHNKFGAKAVYRDLANSKGKTMLELFPKAKEQGLIDVFFAVITTGEAKFIPELIRYDQNFPLTVFSTKFVKCGSDLGAAIFTEITEEYLARQEVRRQKRTLEQFDRLPFGESAQIREMKNDINQLLRQLGRAPKYEESKP